jgi:hypothetical protein
MYPHARSIASVSAGAAPDFLFTLRFTSGPRYREWPRIYMYELARTRSRGRSRHAARRRRAAGSQARLQLSVASPWWVSNKSHKGSSCRRNAKLICNGHGVCGTYVPRHCSPIVVWTHSNDCVAGYTYTCRLRDGTLHLVTPVWGCRGCTVGSNFIFGYLPYYSLLYGIYDGRGLGGPPVFWRHKACID